MKSTHFVHFEGEKAVGTLRILPASSHGHVAKIGRLAVLKSARNNGTGRALMESAHSYLRKTRPEVKEVVIHAQTAVLGFYKGLGYCACSSEFVEDGIPHTKMTLQL